jgi:hypothetical protein
MQFENEDVVRETKDNARDRQMQRQMSTGKAGHNSVIVTTRKG